jgi:hypothetical protein
MPNPTPRHPVRKLTKSVLDSIKPGSKDEFHWCVDPVGFGVRCTPTGKISFVVQGRVEGGVAPPARLSTHTFIGRGCVAETAPHHPPAGGGGALWLEVLGTIVPNQW